MPAIHVPTLVLHRTDDLVVPVHQGRKLAKLIPEARFVELPGNDHLMWAGDQESIVREVEAFVSSIGPRPHDDRMLVTILFTDIVESTETATRLGDKRWRELLDEHHRVVREQLERYPRTRGRDGRRQLPRDLRRPGAGDRVRTGRCRECRLDRHHAARRAAHGRSRGHE